MRRWRMVVMLALALLVGCAAGRREPSPSAMLFRFADGDGYRDLFYGDTPIYRHMTAYDPAKREETYKPYHHIYGMHGEGFITKGAGGLDPHHRGLFLGFNTQYGNFWSCKDVSQKHVQFLTEREFVNSDTAREAAVTEWLDKNEKAVVRDTREVTTRRVAADEILMDFDITLESLAGDVQLGGDPHHGGFHFRAAQEVAGTQPANKSGAGLATYIRPPSAKLIKDDQWQGEPWAACCFAVKSNRYVVIHMDHPDNPRPTTYSTRAYGRFGAFFTTALQEKKPLRLRYRIIVLDGHTHPNPSADELQVRYQRFVSSGN